MKDKVEVDGVEYFLRQEPTNVTLVRTYSAGVHFGEVVSQKGKVVVLKNARRLWSWKGAASLNQVALDGVDANDSKISLAVPVITLTEAIELIPMSQVAVNNMVGAEPWKA